MPRAILCSFSSRSQRKARSESRARTPRASSAASREDRRVATLLLKTSVPESPKENPNLASSHTRQTEDDERLLNSVFVHKDRNLPRCFRKQMLRSLPPPDLASASHSTDPPSMQQRSLSNALSPSTSSSVIKSLFRSESTPNTVALFQPSQKIDTSSATVKSEAQPSSSAISPNDKSSAFFLQTRSSFKFLLLSTEALTHLIRQSNQKPLATSVNPNVTSTTTSATNTSDQPSAERRRKRTRRHSRSITSKRAQRFNSTDDAEVEDFCGELEIVELCEVGWSEDEWCSCGEEDLREEGATKEGKDCDEKEAGGEWTGERRDFWVCDFVSG